MMAFIHEHDMPWHAGEEKMHELLRVPRQENPTSPFLTPGAGYMLMRAPLLALGALDEQKRPWTTVWGGEPGFSRPIGNSIIGIKTLVDRRYDPVVKALLGAGGEEDGDVVRAEGNGKMVGALAIDLETRKRVKIYGRMAAGAIGQHGDLAEEQVKGEVQMVVRVEQSLGNCPKYLNKKQIYPSLPEPKLVSSQRPLPRKALDLLSKSDLFFISSRNDELDMDTNHRGGPPGFVRVLSNSAEEGTTLVYPEYSGNRLYQTLGNLQITPLAGLVFPDFETGDVLYVTGETQILTGKDASKLLAHTNLAVELTVTEVRFVEKGLSFRGQAGEPSPYNPTVRFLREEKAALDGSNTTDNDDLKAELITNEPITPTISRFRFRLIGGTIPAWKAGQYVAFSFEEELNIGYSHMRDDDPRSLNDDFVRTFTVSSPPAQQSIEDSKASRERPDPKVSADEFEITIRKVGVATDFLFRQRPQARLELPIRGFGGEFFFDDNQGQQQEGVPGDYGNPKAIIPVVAGGIGITPLLAQLSVLNTAQLRLFWTVRAEDINLVNDVLSRHPTLAPSVRLFITGIQGEAGQSFRDKIAQLGARVAAIEQRRLQKDDLMPSSISQERVEGNKLHAKLAEKWFVCAGTELRKAVMVWVSEEGGSEVVYEDFSY